jgi:hypothetical protein
MGLTWVEAVIILTRIGTQPLKHLLIQLPP